MPSYRDLLQIVELAVSGAELQPQERAQLETALRQHQQTFKELLTYPVSKIRKMISYIISPSSFSVRMSSILCIH